MSEKSTIQWTHATWNPAIGCDKVSPGCEFCYMMRDGEKYGDQREGVVRKALTTFDAPLKWKRRLQFLAGKLAIADNEKYQKEYDQLKAVKLVFTASLTDIFHPAIDSFRDEIWAIIRQCPEYTFQVLTKRIELVRERLPADWGDGYSNVWLGCTVENQEYVNIRVPQLLSIPAAVHFVSYEPALGAAQFSHIDAELAGHPDYIQINALTGEHTDMGRRYGEVPKLDWIIVGGESGNDKGKWRYRKARLEWYEDVVRECKRSDTPVFMKQMGTWISKELKLHDRHGGER
jgi:protein gp37